MSSNASTELLLLYQMTDMIIVYSILVLSGCLSIVLAMFIIVMITRTKTLHSPANLLVLNTSVATISLVIICFINVSYFFTETVLTDAECRIQAYITYVFLTLTAYSYVIQSISRLFFTVFPQYRSMLSYKSHLLLILSEICGSFLIPLPSLVTRDVTYRPLSICLIPMKYILHVAYFFLSSYFIPLFVVIAVYLIIHRRVRLSSRLLHQASRSSRRDLELTRNILILFTIFLLAGFPAFIYVLVAKITSLPLMSFYMFTVSSTCLAAAIEKYTVIVLNRELRRETRKRFGVYLPCYRMNRTGVQTFTMAAMTVNDPMNATVMTLRKRLE